MKLIELFTTERVKVISKISLPVSLSSWVIPACIKNVFIPDGLANARKSMLIVNNSFVICRSCCSRCCCTSLGRDITTLLFRRQTIMMMLHTRTIGIGVNSNTIMLITKWIDFSFDGDSRDILYSRPIFVLIVLWSFDWMWNTKTSTIRGMHGDVMIT